MSLVIKYLCYVWSFCISVVYLFGPPVAFYLNYRLKWKIPSVVLCLILLLMGWILPFLQIEFIDGRFDLCLEGPSAIVAIHLGWLAYVFVLVHWAIPIATGAFIISRRNRRKVLEASKDNEILGH